MRDVFPLSEDAYLNHSLIEWIDNEIVKSYHLAKQTIKKKKKRILCISKENLMMKHTSRSAKIIIMKRSVWYVKDNYSTELNYKQSQQYQFIEFAQFTSNFLLSFLGVVCLLKNEQISNDLTN